MPNIHPLSVVSPQADLAADVIVGPLCVIEPGVRIGAGRAGTSLLLALPGPNDEVELGLEAAIETLDEEAEPVKIAEAVARVLRQRLTQKMRDRRHASG